WDGTIRIWDVATGASKKVIDLANSSAYTFSYTPDGLYLVLSRLGEPSLDLIEPDSKIKVKSFIGHTNVVSSISFHPHDANTMLTSSWDGTVRVWNVATGMMKKKLLVEKGEVHAAIFTHDGKYIISAGNDRTIRVWDYEQAKVIRKLEGHTAEVSNLTLDKTGKMLVSVSVDGSIKFWNLEKGEEFFEHIHLPGKDWMAVTKEGYFNGTMEGMKYIHFVKGMQVIQTEQLLEKFHKPDLLPSIFKDRGSSGSFKKIEDILRISPMPEIRLHVAKKADKPEAEVYIKLTDNGGGIDEVKLLHNGKRIALSSSNSELPSGKGQHKVLTEIVSLVHGINVFEVSAFNRERIETAPVISEVFSDVGEKGSVCHILAIGINQYVNPSLALNYAREDAEAFSKVMLERSKKLFKDVVIHPIYDDMATKSNILDTLTALANIIQKNDVFIFYYAGHGTLSDEKFYFVPRECVRLYDNNKLEKEAIEATMIQKKFRDIKALKQIIIMDACHSGGSVELLGMRGGSEERAMSQLARSAGVHVFASAGSTQTAKEVKELGHGLFTYLLLKALEGEADGAPKDGKITVFELKSYLDDRTPDLNKKYSGKPQYPYTFSKGHDFPIVVE
ncbi:MAG TPA: caspase family protein, partial [Cytophagaceae bacterium]